MASLRTGLGVLAAAAITAAGAAAVAAEPDAPPSRRAETPTTAKLTCGRATFPPSALKRPRGYERRNTPAAAALRRFIREGGPAEVGQARRGWFLLALGKNQFEVLSGKGPSYGHMIFQRKGGRFEWGGSGGCTPVAYEKGLGATVWELDPPGATLTPEATRIPITLDPLDCSSGQDASGPVLSPRVHYGPAAVTVTYFVRPPEGAQTCPGNPLTHATLVLDEPLGGRALRDGGVYPPRER